MAAWQVYCLVSVLVYHQARDGCAGAPAGDNRPGAGDFSVALEEGAQRKFELFYPEFPGTTTTTQTTLQEEDDSHAVPVIHLPPEEIEGDLAKVDAGVLLDMFPQDLLENNKKVRPVDVKIIEHDGYIDYEIEFIELSDYYDYYLDELEIKDVTTDKSTREELSVPELTFVDLLKHARQEHRKKENRTVEQETDWELEEGTKTKSSTGADDQEEGGESSTESADLDPVTVKPTAAPHTEVNEEREQEKEEEREEITSTVSPAEVLETLTLELPRSSDTGLRNYQDHHQIIDKEESVASDEDEDDLFDQFTEDFQISETRPRLTVYTADTTEKNYDYYEESGPTTKSVEYQDEFSKPERTPKVIRNEKDESLDISNSELETKDEKKVPGVEDNSGYYQHDATGDTAQPYIHDQTGQYKEIHPGQYTEIHPGQYQEQHPGQYHEVNPGQYTLDDEDIEVDVNNRDNQSRIYNVRANAGDFIIGEAGRIDINSGQTLEGVRYTAVESEVDYEKIKEILERYFGAR